MSPVMPTVFPVSGCDGSMLAAGVSPGRSLASMRFALRVAAICGMCAMMPGAFAQPQAQPAAKQPAAQPAMPPAGDAAATALLARVRESWSRVTAMSAMAKVRVEGIDGKPRLSEATLSGAKAEVGDWKLAVKENLLPLEGKKDEGKPEEKSESKAAPRGVELTYDGATARSIRHKDKAVIQRTVVKVADLRSFFLMQEGAEFVPWSLVDADALAEPKYVAIKGKEAVGEVTCTLLEVASEPPIEDDKDRARPREAVVLAVDERTGLVHRIDTVQEAKKNARFVRTLTLEKLRINEDAVLQDFAPATPDGYAVRTRGGMVTGSGPKEAGGKLGPGVKGEGKDGEGAKAGNALPHGITWPHERRALAAGVKIPKFSLKNAAGNKVSNAHYEGKVLVIDFWGTWCPPCRAAMPALQKVHDKFAGKEVAVVGFNYERDPEADPEAFKKKNKYTYDLLLQADDVLDEFKVSGFPTFYVVSPDGTVVWAGVGLGGPPGVARPTPRQLVEYLEETLTKLVEGELAKAEAAKKTEKK